MYKENTKKESGQILVFVVLFVIGMFAMLALVLDGGNTYSKRRAAQNAADAGALAGARTLCVTKDSNQAIAVAQDYATNRNEADSADVNIDGQGYVTVTTKITFATFFAHLIGRPQMTAEATATSGCFPPKAGNVLPIAWACHPPVNGDLSDNEICQIQEINQPTLNNYKDNPTNPNSSPPIWPELYVIMNSNAQPEDLSAICQSEDNPDGELLCDMDGDGENDIVANGDRSWLDLDGSGGEPPDLIAMINGDRTPIATSHVWYGGQPGTDTPVFQEVEAHVGEIFLIPVFDQICDGYPIETECPDVDYHAIDSSVYTPGGNYYYHIIAFAAFYVSCVDSGNGRDSCPGHDAAVDLGIFKNNSVKSIEGYFVDEEVLKGLGGADPNAIDLGVYHLQLFH